MDKNKIEARALELYDQFNPNQDREILVSKAECIRIAKREFGIDAPSSVTFTRTTAAELKARIAARKSKESP